MIIPSRPLNGLVCGAVKIMPRRFILGAAMCSAVREADEWGLQEEKRQGRAGGETEIASASGRGWLLDVGNRCECVW